MKILKFLDCENTPQNSAKVLGAGTTHSLYIK